MENRLKDYDQKSVIIFNSYLNALSVEVDKTGNLKNWWFKSVPQNEFVDKFIQIHKKTGLYIDGDSITFAYRKKLIVNFDYHAYKNAVSLKFPETIFDFGIVYKGDEFSFKKESGKVYYTHVSNDAFATNKEIIGAYGVIKNSQGEFIERLNMDDITKMKNTSQMKGIWDAWFDRMVLKSIIKRICASNFHDITQDMANVDNQTEEPENALIDTSIQDEIKESNTEQEITVIYKKYKNIVDDLPRLIELCGERKKEIAK